MHGWQLSRTQRRWSKQGPGDGVKEQEAADDTSDATEKQHPPLHISAMHKHLGATNAAGGEAGAGAAQEGRQGQVEGGAEAGDKVGSDAWGCQGAGWGDKDKDKDEWESLGADAAHDGPEQQGVEGEGRVEGLNAELEALQLKAADKLLGAHTGAGAASQGCSTARPAHAPLHPCATSHTVRPAHFCSHAPPAKCTCRLACLFLFQGAAASASARSRGLA